VKVHPSAIVDPGAEIAADVEIGPYCIIEANTKIGSGTLLQSNVRVEGSVEIGRRNFVGHGCVIGGQPQDTSFRPSTRSGVRIGDNNIVREYCTIHRGTLEDSATEIGNDNFLMTGVHLGHNCRIGNRVTLANNCLLAGYVEIADQVFVGGATTFHQNMRVGRLVMAQGSSAFGKDIPPFTLAAERNTVFGLNIIGLRRAGFSSAQREEVKRAFTLLYRRGLNTQQALETARTADFGVLGREFFEFVSAARKRGIVPFRRSPNESIAGQT
jgi:UDP-N-acetylglucosamine acyltransferase